MYFIFGCTKSSLLPEAFSSCSEQGLLASCRVQASHCGGFSCCRPWALGLWAQWLWHTGSVAPWHVGSSWTRDRTYVPCIGNWLLNHWTTRKVPIAYSCLLCHSLGAIGAWVYLWIFYPIPWTFCLFLCFCASTIPSFFFLVFIYLAVSGLSRVCGIFHFGT